MGKYENVPKGFKFYGTHVGIKKKRKDFGLIVADEVCHAAAVFTKNTFCGECIPIGKDHVKNAELQAVVVTSGIANVATGQTGRENEYKILARLSDKLTISKENILPSSTGVIGPQLPIDIIEEYLEKETIHLKENYEDFAHAILTTDQRIKVRSLKVGDATILGIVKGSGMIEPNMATMLAYILTDAKVEKQEIYSMLKIAVDHSFNTISIDTDTSTSDTVAFLASSHHEVEKTELQKALNEICKELALDVVRDAEGATKTMFVTVKNAESKEQAKNAGKSIINSPLVKTALFGHDPNWGRIAMALGKTEGLIFDQNKVEIYYGQYPIFSNNNEEKQHINKIATYIEQNEDIHLTVDLHQGTENFEVIGCDLSYEYVKINSDYST
ncbi:glutamate N-acetyltransferase/amino-acid acetyltransferase [Enterococcus haemoperoxidus ATCC BAA-382]|uniref:Arginine biosynthesis bifunctional protein ArgJ n=1 Tax=Enterococcus haemoperoxidus ATCC BAA-382 TaxID=1158608 RepID=R2SWF9_9ENTE|nr:bifunctional glutamate N-acetyltransferase/amino-acid acetyltransferase ArgJ [Enterococcus haemoperoxidus]EOH99565.1 glutamate N-acetyltransferase/amino-acid acetyltransferase [Enterococcus haemoperoxidus ATCC BAA-382]EOT62695.1 glutamate N-acetyltransferase/amino-acid acetyltransferase [Enterococcus haemoperoxidus ATCC BAA-382]